MSRASDHHMKANVPDSPRGALRHEIVGLLCLKLLALVILYWAFFGPSTRLHPSQHGLSAHILASEAVHTD